MTLEPVVIPDKIYFKIGEVCELVGVQAHVLRYWETEFPMLSPQKNKSGQRSYRRKDVEIALRIKQLLYNEMFTIAGARKKLQSENRSGSKPSTSAVVPEQKPERRPVEAPTLFDNTFDIPEERYEENVADDPVETHLVDATQREALKIVATHLLELREMLRSRRV